jgi:hypothetical protein
VVLDVARRKPYSKNEEEAALEISVPFAFQFLGLCERFAKVMDSRLKVSQPDVPNRPLHDDISEGFSGKP